MCFILFFVFYRNYIKSVLNYCYYKSQAVFVSDYFVQSNQIQESLRWMKTLQASLQHSTLRHSNHNRNQYNKHHHSYHNHHHRHYHQPQEATTSGYQATTILSSWVAIIHRCITIDCWYSHLWLKLYKPMVSIDCQYEYQYQSECINIFNSRLILYINIYFRLVGLLQVIFPQLELMQKSRE